MTVLVVDDHEDAAFATGHMVKLLGHDVELAYGGQQALDKVSQSTPDLIFLDINMPIMDGLETCKKLRSMPALNKTIIVALTGQGTDELVENCKEIGFDHHFLKPLYFKSIEELLKSVKPVPKSQADRQA